MLGKTQGTAANAAAPLVIGAPSQAFHNQPGLNALGFISRLPVTEGCAPVLPWLGMVWWGVAAGRWALAHRPQWLGAGDTPASGFRRIGVVLGRWSLSYYLLHQPVMIGLLMVSVS